MASGAQIAAPFSLKERLLEFSVPKHVSFPFSPHPIRAPKVAKNAWASDIIRWLASLTENGSFCGEFLTKKQVCDFVYKSTFKKANWSESELEELYKVTKAIQFYQTVHRAARTVFMKARTIQTVLMNYLKPIACSAFHEVSLEEWIRLLGASFHSQIADILSYPEAVLAMMAYGFSTPISPSWFEHGYPPVTFDGQALPPFPTVLGEPPSGTKPALVAVNASWLKPRGQSSPLAEALGFMKPPEWDIE
jgi:hypothetical protein